jgi:hypothetical protein
MNYVEPSSVDRSARCTATLPLEPCCGRQRVIP